mgnify:CR=1 FL=1
MSRGIGAHANLILEDEKTIIYEYGGFNLNDLEYRNEKQIYFKTYFAISWLWENDGRWFDKSGELQ